MRELGFWLPKILLYFSAGVVAAPLDWARWTGLMLVVVGIDLLTAVRSEKLPF